MEPTAYALTWHPRLQRYIGHGGRGLVVTVAASTVEAVYADQYAYLLRYTRDPDRADAGATARALQAGLYAQVAAMRAAPRRTPYPRHADWDVWLTHPANLPGGLAGLAPYTGGAMLDVDTDALPVPMVADVALLQAA